MRRTAEILVLISIATLFFRQEVFYLFKLFEIGIMGAILCMLVYAIRSKKNPFKELPDALLWLTLFCLMLFWSAVGTANGYRVYGIADPVKTVGGFFYLGIGMAAFLLVRYYGRNARFRNALYACFLSPLLLAPFIFMPDIAEKLGFVTDKIHFFGLHKNPTTFAFLASLSCIILIRNCFDRGGSNRRKILSWLGIVALISLCLWTGSRAAWLALILSYAWMAFYRHRSLWHLSVLCGAAVITLTTSFAILPHQIKIMAVDRIYPQISDSFPDADKLKRISLATTLGFVISSRPSLPYQSRQSLWPQSIALFTEHPIGLGVEYFRSAKAIWQNNYPTHSHNTALQAILTGGVGLLVTYLFFVYGVVIKIRDAKKDTERLMLSGMLVACAVFLMIGEYLYVVPYFWIVAGLACAKGADTA